MTYLVVAWMYDVFFKQKLFFFQFLNVVEFDRHQRDMGNGP